MLSKILIRAAFGFAAIALSAPAIAAAQDVSYYDVPKGDGPHDVAPAPDGTVWYTGQRAGVLGRLDPKTGKVDRVPLGEESAPHGVIIGPDGAAWVTDGGLNAILRVDPVTREVKRWPLPRENDGANLNTSAFDSKGRIWFTGQSGVFGRLDPKTGDMKVWDAPRGTGPYGITATPDGQIWYVSLAGSYLGRPDLDSGEVSVIDPPKKASGPRRVWSELKWASVGQRMERRHSQRLRPPTEGLADVGIARQKRARLRGLCRRREQGLGVGLRDQRHPALRPDDGKVRELPQHSRQRQRASNGGPSWRGVGGRIGH